MTDKKQIKKVKKEWGSEEWIVNREYCGKILNINRGFRCSMHYHKNKDETFYLIDGAVLLELADKKLIMNKGDVQIIERGQKHRFNGLKKSRMIEFSTHHEDSDSYRDELSGKIDINKLNELAKSIAK